MRQNLALGVLGAAFFIFGVIGFVHGRSLDAAARNFKSANLCQPARQDTDCYEQRAIRITSVGTGRQGEVNTVDFLDHGNARESMVIPGGQDTSVLQVGASGFAIRWHGTYTNLDFGGLDFVTGDNPAGKQGLWTLFGILGIGCGVVVWAMSFVAQAVQKPA